MIKHNPTWVHEPTGAVLVGHDIYADKNESNYVIIGGPGNVPIESNTLIIQTPGLIMKCSITEEEHALMREILSRLVAVKDSYDLYKKVA